jgi:hypothetical protein
MIWQFREKNLGTLSQTLSSPEGSRSVLTDQQQQDIFEIDIKGKMHEQNPLALDIWKVSG